MYSEKIEHPWKKLAQQITEERDPQKIIEFATELIRVFDEERKLPQKAKEPVLPFPSIGHAS